VRGITTDPLVVAVTPFSSLKKKGDRQRREGEKGKRRKLRLRVLSRKGEP